MTDHLASQLRPLLQQGRINYRAVKDLRDALHAPFSLSGPTTAVMAIVRDVKSDWIGVEKSRLKTVHLIDPTLPSGLYVTIWCPKGTVFTPGSILRIRGLQKSQKRDGTFHFKAESDNVTQFPIFKYDYEEDEPPDFFTEYQDRNICEVLEKWYADHVSRTRLQDLAEVVHRDPHQRVTYVDLVGQPWRKRYMDCSMAMTFTDGSVPSIKTKDPYNKDYAGFVEGECVDGERAGMGEIDHQKFAHINIWNNEIHKSNPSHHFETAHLHDLTDDWWLLFLNVELKYNPSDEEVELNLRSGHHQGKGIRTISKNSVLGRKLMHRWEKPDPR